MTVQRLDGLSPSTGDSKRNLDGNRPARWSCLAEYVLGDWDRTWRATVLVLVLAVCVTAPLVVMFGATGAGGVAVALVVARLIQHTARSHEPAARQA